MANREELLREIARTRDDYLAALECLALWEDANPWPDTEQGITEKHWQWRRAKNAVDHSCGFSRKAQMNIEAYRAARLAGVFSGGRHAEA